MAQFCIDASVVVASLTETEPGYAASAAFLARWIDLPSTLVAPDLLKVEVAAAVSRATNDEQAGLLALQNMKRFVGINFLSFSPAAIELVARTAAAFKLRTGDAFYVAIAVRERIPLVTLDREIIRIANQTGSYEALIPSAVLD